MTPADSSGRRRGLHASMCVRACGTVAVSTPRLRPDCGVFKTQWAGGARCTCCSSHPPPGTYPTATGTPSGPPRMVYAWCFVWLCSTSKSGDGKLGRGTTDGHRGDREIRKARSHVRRI
eukprot:1351269-Prymnesium_polylepis.1